MNRIHQKLVLGFGWLLVMTLGSSRVDAQVTAEQLAAIEQSLLNATEYFHTQVAVRGGYVFHYSLDLQTRWGEGRASATQIWVQPPGTPTVGNAFLDAYVATHDERHLQAAVDAGNALVFGQLKSGGWTSAIDFDPQGDRSADYANGLGRGKNHSTLDDDTTQGALRFLMRLDQIVNFEHETIHQATLTGLDALLEAQYPNGGFPQVWMESNQSTAEAVAANFPTYDWRTENRIKEYWDLYTLNDDLAGDLVSVLLLADQVYDDPRFAQALEKFGDFLILAQLPEPQPAWAQQYDFEMRPVWARKFEPPAISGGESQDVVEALLRIYHHTGEARFLRPIPSALLYLQRSELPDGRLARFYELQSNQPLYMNQEYELTYDDGDLPSHYSWKVRSKREQLQEQFDVVQRSEFVPSPPIEVSLDEALAIVGQQDEQGRWVSVASNERLVGQPKIQSGERYLSTTVFATNMALLSRFLEQSKIE